MANRILTTHAGSLPRPDDLVQLMYDRIDGNVVDEQQLETRIKDAVGEVVALQRQVGIDLPSDGEMSKPGFSNYICQRLTGFGGRGQFFSADLGEFPDFAARLFSREGSSHIVLPTCEGPVESIDSAAVERDIANFKAALAGNTQGAFICAATPGQIAFNFANKYYPSHEAYLAAAAKAMRPEYEAIANAGFDLQLDSPDLAMAGHCAVQGTSLTDFPKHLEQAIEALNEATRNISPDKLRLHVCWGNYAGPHHRDVPLTSIVQALLKANVRYLYVEAANPRHEHEWEVWQDVPLPDDKALIIGAIDVLTNHVEHPRLVAQRITRFANIVGRERVIAGTDCGFGTFVGSSVVDPRIAWLKLRSLVEGASEASRELFGAAAVPA
jgi:5-methyltetrahydropteroyltriglutamate--homocysteine methyltransferase